MTEYSESSKLDDKSKLIEIEYYSAGYNAWFNSALERDRSLLALSAGGVGILTTLMTTVGIKSAESLVLYIVAIFFFLVCLVLVLLIFDRNKTHIMNVLNGKDNPDTVLKIADKIALFSFGTGALLTVIIGISSAISSYSTKDSQMAIEKKNHSNVQPSSIKGSVDGMAPLKKSFSGAEQLKPQQPAETSKIILPATSKTYNSK